MLKKTVLYCLIFTLVDSYIYSCNASRAIINSKSLCPLSRQGGNTEFYSQYLEDYILSIVLEEIKTGCYIDIGSNSPDVHSVTKHFYLKGWRGINIEPIEQWHYESLSKRPEDINLNLGISDKSGVLKFFKIFSRCRNNNYRLSTFSEEVLAQAVKDGYDYESCEIQVKTFNQILEIHPLKNITFVKIDVEGTERQVLRGINLKIYRPIIFVIEATKPRTSIPSYQEWESILLDNNYKFIMFDGLNRYYLAKEHQNKFLNKFKKAYKCASTQNQTYHITKSPMFFKKAHCNLAHAVIRRASEIK